MKTPEKILDELLDSKSYTTESAIPLVVEDAAEVIRHLKKECDRLEALCFNLLSQRDIYRSIVDHPHKDNY